jgi:hypothetical protein
LEYGALFVVGGHDDDGKLGHKRVLLLLISARRGGGPRESGAVPSGLGYILPTFSRHSGAGLSHTVPFDCAQRRLFGTYSRLLTQLLA